MKAGNRRLLGMALVVLSVTVPARGSALILNEYNAVSGTRFLNGRFADKVDTYFGRILGNGGNWLEFVVTEDHADLRNWSFDWLYWNDGNGAFGSFATAQEKGMGTIQLTNDGFWADLRRGTILTISEKLSVDEVIQDPLNLEDPEFDIDTGFDFDLSTDLSLDPQNGDWHQHLWGGASQYMTHTGTIWEAGVARSLDVAGGEFFAVNNDNWEISLFNAADVLQSGPFGERAPSFAANRGGGGINNEEIGKLEADPTASATNADFNDGSSSSFGAPNIWTDNEVVSTQDFTELRDIPLDPLLVGDANSDCVVGAADYALWAAQFGQSGPDLSADFDGNGSVGAGDYALWAANFGNSCPPTGASVPEPSTLVLLVLGAVALLAARRGPIGGPAG